jgi:hypothetical protein
MTRILFRLKHSPASFDNVSVLEGRMYRIMRISVQSREWEIVCQSAFDRLPLPSNQSARLSSAVSGYNAPPKPGFWL